MALLAAGALAPPGAGAASHPLQTGIADYGPYLGPDADLAFARTRAAGATFVRLFVSWRGIAPQGASKPAGFDPTNPADPNYYWAQLDAQVKAAVRHGLQPILSVFVAPSWAQRGTPEAYFLDGATRPDPTDLGEFATALARRYSGTFQGLPRVRYLQDWNETNLQGYLFPQYDTPWGNSVTAASHPVSPEIYAPMVNAFAAAVHAVHRDNVVIAGGLAPFGKFGVHDHGVQPLVFMRQLLCLTSRDRPKPGCNRRVQFDAWGQDPYTAGGPQHRAELPGNVSIGNLPQVQRTLRAAVRAGHIQSNGPVRFYVVEFAWNTKPPFSQGVPVRLHARWTAEALYEMWRDGVSLVAWFQLRDDAVYDFLGSHQSGLYFRCARSLACDRPKPALTAFRFPFVAYRSGGRVLVWGRTPAGERGRVTVEQHTGAGWRTLATLRTDRYGIFTARLPRRGSGDLRSRFGRTASLAFSLHRPPDRVINPPL